MQHNTCNRARISRISDWTFLTNHGHVLVYVARNPDARIREIATEIGVIERTVQTILNDLVGAGYVTRDRRGRRNHYSVDPSAPFRHPLESDHAVGSLLEALADQGPGGRVTR
ncbi:MAG: helix-turn-helix transcriptional regulator [Solirubrobacterales bacterium]